MRTTALACALLLAACSDPATPAPASDASIDGAADAPDATRPDAPSVADAAPEDAPRPSLALEWSPCDDFAGVPEGRAECAVVAVPLDWERPDGERIDLFVRHVRAAEPSGRALWILMGGPGQAGADGESLAAVLAQRDPGLDVYLHDHRGTGVSTRLECPDAESPASPGGPGILPAEWPGCREQVVATWGERLRHFSTTAAARDLAGLIDATRAPGDRAFVLGISYGTYLAHRYLQIAPAQAAGVVLDSLCPPGECHLSQQDQWEDGEARAILARCAAEPACAQRLGADPVGRLIDLHRRVAEGHCPIAPTPARSAWLLRASLGSMMMSAPLRRIVPAVVHRMTRCGEADRAALRALYATLHGPQWLAVSALVADGAPGTALAPPSGLAPFGGGAGSGYSFPLAINIVVSEMWEPADPSPAELTRRWRETLACRGVSRQAGWQTPGWPRYADPLAAQRAGSDVPILLLNAEHDPATPARYARAFAERLRAPHQRYVEIPHAAHGVLGQGALADAPTTTCGRELALQFLRDPRAALDTGCLARTVPLAFTASPQLAQQVLGTTDLWGD